MKFYASALTIALALTAVSGCSSSSDTATTKDSTVAAATGKPDTKVVDAAFALDAAMRKVAAKDKTSAQQSTVLLQLVAGGKVDKTLTVAGTATDGSHILIWDGTEQRASAEDLALKQSEIEISSGTTSICMRLAADPALFITDVPAMKEQLKQYPKASGIVKITADGKPACGHGQAD